ncbi:MAG: hypothetical protein ACKVQU_02770 [Burkholderiales bacterium]
MFNLIEIEHSDNVDFWILTDEPFDRARFERRLREPFDAVTLAVSSPEDTILMKLKWAQMSGGSAKQFGDALRVFEVQHDTLDMPYMEYWAVELGTTKLFERIRAEARPLT